MCHTSSVEFARGAFEAIDLRGKSVLEVGALDFNGSVRAIALAAEPSHYLGVDIQSGPGVDLVCDGAELSHRFGPDSFDVVIATELLEHARDWRAVITNMKQVLREAGAIVITTRSRGFDYHAYPHDYWRYELDDMRRIFADFEILRLEQDHEKPGVFVQARKPANWRPIPLDAMRLYSILRWQRRQDVRPWDLPIGIVGNIASRWVRTAAARLPAGIKQAIKRRLRIV